MVLPGSLQGGHSSENTKSLRVDSWTGVIVKGANETVPLYVSLHEPYVCDNLRVTLADVRCKAVLDKGLITAIVPVFELPPDCGRAGLRIFFGNDEKDMRLVSIKKEVESVQGKDARVNTEVDELPVMIVDLVRLAYPDVKGWAQTLGAITYAEEVHRCATQLNSREARGVDREVAMLVSKTHPSDVPAIYVFGLSNGKAQLDRYEASEQNLADQKKWEFIDHCTLTELTVSSKGDESFIGIAHDVDFIYKPDEFEHHYHVRLRVGEYEFIALWPVGHEWINWFTKQWVPRVAAGVGDGDDNIERFTAPTISSLIKRQRKVGLDFRPAMYAGSVDPRSASPGSPGRGGYPSHYDSVSPNRAPKYDLMSTTQSPPGVRPTIMHNSAPELLPYHKGDMVKGMGPRRAPELNKSGDVAMALKANQYKSPTGSRSRP